MKNGILSVFANWIGISALLLCSCSNEDVLPTMKDYGRLRLERMDLSGAVSVGLRGTDSSSRAIEGEYLSAGLYKVDADGNISAIGVYFSTDTLGQRLEHEEYLRVVPTAIADLTENYMLVVGCSYYDAEGDHVGDKWIDNGNDETLYVRQNVPYLDLLVRKSDGKIWCVDKISDILCSYYSSGELYLLGSFKEDSTGSLYFQTGMDIYKFDLDRSTPKFEQVVNDVHMYGIDSGFFISHNGVMWCRYPASGSYSSSEITFAWPRSGYQTISNYDIYNEIASGLERTIPGATIYPNYYGNLHGYYPIVYDTFTMKLMEDVHVLFASCDNYNPVALVMSAAEFDLYSNKQFNFSGDLHYYYNMGEPLISAVNNSNWPVGLMYDLTIGNSPGSAKLSENPIALQGLPDGAVSGFNFSRDVYGTEFTSVYVGDGYLLTSGTGNWITKIDLVKRDWQWLKQLDYAIDFTNSTSYAGKVWLVDCTQEHFGAYWFDPVSFEDGFVKFKVSLPSFFHPLKTETPGKDGKMRFFERDPSTGDYVSIVIDITTGKAITDEIETEYKFVTLISLN